MKLKDKIKNYGFWTGLSAAIIMLIDTLGRAFGFSVDNGIVDNVIMSICSILVVFGVVSKPPNKAAEETEEIIDDNKDEEK